MFWNRKKNRATAVSMTDEQKMLVDTANRLIEETQNRSKHTEQLVTLTGLFQLRDDCRLVEQLRDRFLQKPGIQTEEALRKGIIRLQTTSEQILDWEFNDK
ncbi:MAG: hypothetical protein Q4B22_01125 [Eubacteriales bacterium]|nr:hypothetical protein [Eubacteriales bacterium]